MDESEAAPLAAGHDVETGRQPRRSRDDGIRAGWHLFADYAREAIPRQQRWTILTIAAAVGVVASAGVDLLIGLDPTATALFSALAGFAGGFGIASLVVTVLLLRWSRVFVPDAYRQPFPGTAAPDPSVSASIRRAWRAGHEPDAPLHQRVAAAHSARAVRLVFPRMALANLPLLGSGLSAAALAALFSFGDSEGHRVTFVGVYGPMMMITWGGSLFWNLHRLGRTRAPIETAPAVPDYLEPTGRPKPRPRTPHKLLGTDHPDDFR